MMQATKGSARQLTVVFLLEALAFLGCLVLPTRGYTSKKPPFLTRQDMCGIWKLIQPRALPSSSSSSSSSSSLEEDETTTGSSTAAGEEDEIVLRLNDDGTFNLPPDEEEKSSWKDLRCDLRFMLCRGGCWEYRDQTLLLAADRPPLEKSSNAVTSAVNDTLLVGKLLVHVSECLTETIKEEPIMLEDDDQDGESAVSPPTTVEGDIDVHLSIPKGQISTGKFMYPKKHKAFFEEPVLFQRWTVGTFHMNQILGNLNARLKSEREAAEQKERSVAMYHKKDFYNRTFYLTASPHPVNPVYAAADTRYDEDKAMMDIRVMPITFYPNNTFAAIGTEKILRGRYGLCGEERERLWFQVSLFGAGRSAPGSVYSEGRLLSKDDQRGYVGPIQSYPNKNNETVLFVDGEFYYGEDLKMPRKTRSWGCFTLQELDIEEEEEEEDDDDNTVSTTWDEDAFQ